MGAQLDDVGLETPLGNMNGCELVGHELILLGLLNSLLLLPSATRFHDLIDSRRNDLGEVAIFAAAALVCQRTRIVPEALVETRTQNTVLGLFLGLLDPVGAGAATN